MERWKELQITDFKTKKIDGFSYFSYTAKNNIEICIEPLMWGYFHIAIYKNEELLEPKKQYKRFNKKYFTKHITYLYKKYIEGGDLNGC